MTLRPIAFNHFYDPSLMKIGGSFIKIARRRGQRAVNKLNYAYNLLFNSFHPNIICGYHGPK